MTHEEIIERLREIEWAGDEDGWPACPACGGLQGCAHKPACWLAAAIAGKETEATQMGRIVDLHQQPTAS
jgi:hypothetical protein